MLVRLATHALDAGRESLDPFLQRRQAGFGRRGQRQPARAPVKELRAELILEAADLLADGRRRHVQLGRGPREAQVAGSGLEGDQGVEGQGA